MKRQKSFYLMRHRETLQRVGLLVLAVGIVVTVFGWHLGSSDTPEPDEGSLTVNINTATRVEIESLPGVGGIRAMQIISNRPYASVDDLQRVYGIATDEVERMRPYVKVKGDTEERDRVLAPHG